MKRLLWTFGVAVALGALPLPAAADSITFAGSSGSLAASVTFVVDGSGNLTVILTNTSTSTNLSDADVLTGVYFDIASNPTLTPVSGLLTAGSTVLYDPDGQPAGGVIGGEFAYATGLVGAPGGASQGISSAGLGLFGPPDLFPGPDLAGPPSLSPDGPQYGILSAGFTGVGANASITGSGGMIQNSVTFTLSGLVCGSPTLTAGPSIAAVSVADCGISNVNFQYGTALTDASFPGDPGEPVPEPGTLLLLGAGLSGLAGLRRRRGQEPRAG